MTTGRAEKPRQSLDGPPGGVAGVGLLLVCTWVGFGRAREAIAPPLWAESIARLAWRVDVNHAPEHELTLLTRIGPTLAARIVQDRTEHGAYASVADLDRVRGIGPRTVLGIEPHAVAR